MGNLTKEELLGKLEQANRIIRGLTDELHAGIGDNDYGDYCVYCGSQDSHDGNCWIVQGRVWLGWDTADAIATTDDSRVRPEFCHGGINECYLPPPPLVKSLGLSNGWWKLERLSAEPIEIVIHDGIEICRQCEKTIYENYGRDTVRDFGPVSALPKCPECNRLMHKWLDRKGTLAALESWEKRKFNYNSPNDALLMLYIIDGLLWYYSDIPQIMEFARSVLEGVPIKQEDGK